MKKNGQKWAFAAIILLMAWGCSSPAIAIGEPAPDFSAQTIGEETLQLSDFKGSYTILYFWRTDCEACRSRHEDFMRVYEKYQNARFVNGFDLHAVGIALEDEQTDVLTAAREDKLRIRYHALNPPPDEQVFEAPLAKMYQVQSLPAIFLVDGRGILIGKAITISELDALLKEHLL